MQLVLPPQEAVATLGAPHPTPVLHVGRVLHVGWVPHVSGCSMSVWFANGRTMVGQWLDNASPMVAQWVAECSQMVNQSSTNGW